ncbi:hypothetical protein CBR_g41688 [Chara braunii]|uniref:PDZ domain-containing protein n=1 Tax=Chara braunii TaxID=69332 RepID=A0A388LWH8_CHABU|nr:hypothetical protein CBR_g41688 [Chara braunii]|eukprot:GBG86625.1 hypothetical protein CBR_g41688 [Chara braunii]
MAAGALAMASITVSSSSATAATTTAVSASSSSRNGQSTSAVPSLTSTRVGVSLPRALAGSCSASAAISEVVARGGGSNIEVEVDKPLGLTLDQKSGGGVVISNVQPGGNAAKAGLKAGDQVLYTSSFFGDELWPADKLAFTKTAVQAKADSVYFVVARSVSPVRAPPLKLDGESTCIVIVWSQGGTNVVQIVDRFMH